MHLQCHISQKIIYELIYLRRFFVAMYLILKSYSDIKMLSTSFYNIRITLTFNLNSFSNAIICY